MEGLREGETKGRREGGTKGRREGEMVWILAMNY